jgi:hypothetical protein
MRKRFLLFVCGLALFAPASMRSQIIQTKPGDANVHGENLQPYTNEWHMKLTRADGTTLQDAGTWTDQLEPVESNGRLCWKRTQRATFKKSTGEIAATNQTVNIFDRKTFEPISREFSLHPVGGADSGLKITFAGKSMKVESTKDGKTETREVVTTPAFDFYGGVYALLWAALPLQEGFTATLPSYTEDEHPEIVTLVTHKVMGQETASAGKRGTVKAWVIESDTMIGILKYWVSEKEPYIIRMDYKSKDGATWVLTMI